MKLFAKAGLTSQRARVFLQDSSSATGAGLTGLAFGTGNLKWSYIREDQSTATAVTLVTATLGTWASGGFKEIDSTLLPGVYEIGIPDAALASGKNVQMLLFGATNLAPTPIEIQLVSVDHQDATRFGLAALPNVAQGSSGALPTGNASGQVTPVPATIPTTAQMVTAIDGTSTQLAALVTATSATNASIALAQITATVVSDAGNSTTVLTVSGITASPAGLVGMGIEFTGGTAANLKTRQSITAAAVNGSNIRLTIGNALGSIPAAGDTVSLF